MARSHDNVPVHIRTRVDSETGDEYVVATLEVDGAEYDLYSWPAANFEKVLDHLKNGVPDGA